MDYKSMITMFGVNKLFDQQWFIVHPAGINNYQLIIGVWLLMSLCFARPVVYLGWNDRSPGIIPVSLITIIKSIWWTQL